METPSIAYMKEYFSKAVELERHVHTLRGAMEKANEEMGAIYEEEDNAARKEEYCTQQLNLLDQKYIGKAKELKLKNATDRKNLPKCRFFLLVSGLGLSVALIVLIVSFGTEILTGAYANNAFSIIVPLMILYACAPLFIINLIRVKRIKSRLGNKKADLNAEKEAERDMLLGDIDNSKCRAVELVKSKTELEMIQDMIASKYRMATEALNRLYGKNLVAPKYHNFRAMAAFYDYLYTGRCIAVFGPDGVIDTYEDDVRIGIMIAHLSRIEDVLVDTNIKMGYLCDQAELANKQLAKINSNLAAIKISSAATAANTAEIASYCRSIDESVHRIDRFFF